MPTPGEARSRFRVDRLLSNLCWVLLLGVALVTVLDALATGGDVTRTASLRPRVFLLLVAILCSVSVTFLLPLRCISRLLPALTVAVDTLFTIRLILSSGGASSSLLSFAPLSLLTAVLRFERPISLPVAMSSRPIGALHSAQQISEELRPVQDLACQTTKRTSSYDQRGGLGLIDMDGSAELAGEGLSTGSGRAQRTEVRLTIELEGTS